MEISDRFKWIDFYSAFASKLTEYKNNRSALIMKIRNAYENIGIPLPKLEADNDPKDIDPFTVFGLFNKGITNANRTAVIRSFISEFSVKADVPSDFLGVPVLNNMKSTFYRFEGDRQEHDIDNLWTVFETAIMFADDESEGNQAQFCAAYDRVLPQYAIKWNLTMGLYWIRPYTFLNLDSRNRDFLSNPENVPVEFAAEIRSMRAVPSAEKYLKIRDDCKEIFSMGTYDFDSFPKLSYNAWSASTSNQKPEDDENQNDISLLGKRCWLLSWNPSNWEWVNYSQICAETTSEHTYLDQWSCSSKKPIVGEDVFLMKLGHDKPRGIIGHGTVHRESYMDDHYDENKASEGKQTNHIDVDFDCLLNYKNERILLQDELNKQCPSQTWNPQSSGIEIKAEVIPTLKKMWSEISDNHLSGNITEWTPSLNEYTPGFSVEQWLELLHDKDLIYDDDFIGEIWGGVLAMFYTEKDGASCKKIGQKFNLSSSKVIARCNQLAQHIHAKTKCPLYQEKYWPILFVGRNAKPGEVGTYLWKLRSELYEALAQFDILRYLPESMNSGAEEENMAIDDTLFSRNMILYGPPGTGKTYNAVNYAVAICESKNPEKVQSEDYEDVLYRFNFLKNEGRIAFTTFHQSYGYEEFIEGIQPVTDKDDSSKLEYIIRDGIFKSFCERAIEESIQPYNTDPDNENPRIWGMILGGNENPGIKKQCFENNEIRLGFSEYKDENIADDNEPQSGISWQAKHMINDFRYMMKSGDYVVIEKDYRHIDAVGIVSGGYEYDDSQSYPRKRSVNWLVKGIDEEIIPYLPEGRSRLSRFSLFDFDYLGMDSISLILQRNNAAARSKKPFVFIIDEINRGNISKIFGELITLIEGTKREGADEAMDVILPYSGKRFSVPDNVYILGTMNTADRSIALLDTALRRRFDFVEMMPDNEFLKGVIVEDSGEIIDIRKMFDTMNQRIEILYDREHMIGHAYFIKLREEPTMETLREIFLNRIIPLLQEYFYDDYEKIQLVLGDNDRDVDTTAKFIVEEEVRYSKFFRGKADNDDFDGKKIYRINKDAFSNPASYRKIYE